MMILGYLGALITGVSLGLIGGGGSILIVPILVYLFGVAPSLATAYSLFVVGVSSLVGATSYAKHGLVDYKTAVIFATPAFMGVFLARRYIIPVLPEEIIGLGSFTLTKEGLIMLVFAVVMLAAAVTMIRKKPGASDLDETDAPEERSFNYPMIALEGLAVGGVTGFVGAGGGFLIIPALVILAKLPMKLAVGTSLVIIAAKSLLGFLGDLGGGQAIDWTFMMALTGLAVLGIFAGTKLSQYIPGKRLQKAFGFFVLIMGGIIFVQQLA